MSRINDPCGCGAKHNQEGWEFCNTCGATVDVMPGDNGHVGMKRKLTSFGMASDDEFIPGRTYALLVKWKHMEKSKDSQDVWLLVGHSFEWVMATYVKETRDGWYRDCFSENLRFEHDPNVGWIHRDEVHEWFLLPSKQEMNLEDEDYKRSGKETVASRKPLWA